MITILKYTEFILEWSSLIILLCLAFWAIYNETLSEEELHDEWSEKEKIHKERKSPYKDYYVESGIGRKEGDIS